MQDTFLFPVEEKEEEQIGIGCLSFHIKNKYFGSSKESEITIVHLPCCDSCLKLDQLRE